MGFSGAFIVLFNFSQMVGNDADDCRESRSKPRVCSGKIQPLGGIHPAVKGRHSRLQAGYVPGICSEHGRKQRQE